MNDKSLKLANPVTGAANMITEFLSGDKNVLCRFDFKKHVLRVYPQCPVKARALASMLRDHLELGKLRLDIVVYAPNLKKAKAFGDEANPSTAAIVTAALKGNKYFKKIVSNEDPAAGIVGVYCVFAKKVLQYPNDNLADLHGLTSLLAEDVARTVFCKTGVLYSTSDK